MFELKISISLEMIRRLTMGGQKGGSVPAFNAQHQKTMSTPSNA